MNIKTKLSTLWIIILFNLLFADILSIFVAMEYPDSIHILGEVKTTMAIAAIITNIPIIMIFLSRSLSRKNNRLANSIAAILSLVFVIGGGSSAPHYFICAGIEVICLLIILKTVLSWKEENHN